MSAKNGVAVAELLLGTTVAVGAGAVVSGKIEQKLVDKFVIEEIKDNKVGFKTFMKSAACATVGIVAGAATTLGIIVVADQIADKIYED